VSRERRESLGEEEAFSLDLKTATESLLRTVFGSEFQTAGAEHRKARFANVVVVLEMRPIATDGARSVARVCARTGEPCVTDEPIEMPVFGGRGWGADTCA